MPILTESEKTDIAEQILAVESATGGEIVTVITERSDDYRYFGILWAALAALCVPGFYFLYSLSGSSGWSDTTATSQGLFSSYVIQALVFVALAMVFQWEPIRLRLIPPHIKKMRASRNAQSQFLTQQVHWTTHRAGILIFVSIAERHVEILVDHRVGSKVDTAVWQEIVDQFIKEVRQGNVAEGFRKTVTACGEVLASNCPELRKMPQGNANHLPPGTIDSEEGEPNPPGTGQLPNHLIEV